MRKFGSMATVWEHGHNSWAAVCEIRAQLLQVKNSYKSSGTIKLIEFIIFLL